MRCLSLADALKARGAKVQFVCRYLPEHISVSMIAKEYQVVRLSPANWPEPSSDSLTHAQWLGTSQAEDAAATTRAISDKECDWLVVDHYALDANWERAMRRSVKRILALDDIADRQHDCDILLDQNLYPNMGARYSEKVRSGCRMLLGPHYALLRHEFHQLRQRTRPRAWPVSRVLLFFGGVDATSYTSVAIEALDEATVRGMNVDVVIGAEHPNRKQIQAACSERRFECHVQSHRMAELMAAADLALGAGGSATWERCCLGLPTLIVTLAENQTAIARSLDLAGAGVYIGSYKTADVGVIRRSLLELFEHPNRLKALSEKAYSLVDGLGAFRVCEELGI